MVRRMIAIVMVFICFGVQPFAYAQHHDTKNNEIWKSLDDTSDQILQLVKQNKFEEAKQLLEYFSKQFLALDHKTTTLSMRELQVATTSFGRAEEGVTAVSMSDAERVKLLTEFRLVVDALNRPERPLWLSTKNQTLSLIQGLKKTAEQKEIQSFRHQFNELSRQYSMIRPALVISVPRESISVQKIDSLFQFIERYDNDVLNDKDHRKQLDLLAHEFEKLYEQIYEDYTDPSLLWVIFTVGGMIILSLSYVGYKKYKAEKSKVRMKG